MGTPGQPGKTGQASGFCQGLLSQNTGSQAAYLKSYPGRVGWAQDRAESATVTAIQRPRARTAAEFARLRTQPRRLRQFRGSATASPWSEASPRHRLGQQQEMTMNRRTASAV